MALIVTLGYASAHVLRYECTQDGMAGVGFVIPNVGGPTPDLLTDARTGAAFSDGPSPLVDILNAGRNGYGPLAAGGVTVDQAKQLLFSSFALAVADVITNDRIVTASTAFFMMDPITFAQQAAQPNIDGAGNPVVEITSEGGGLRSTYLLEIRVPAS